MFTSWVLPILLSAIVLGIYDVFKKHAVSDNAVEPVLLVATFCGAVCMAIWMLCTVPPGLLLPTWREFGLVLIKSLIVASSWLCVYYALRIMPFSLVTPIRATSPLWTVLASLLLFQEYPTLVQGIGMAVIFVGYYLFSVWGKLDGFNWRSRGMILIVLGTLLGSGSALYDKYLLHTAAIDRQLMQLHFALDLVAIYGVLVLVSLLRKHRAVFRWRWSIPATGMSLIVADFMYFYALSFPDAHISILSLIRRCNVVVAFGIGCVVFKEKNLKRKAWSLLIIIIGTVLLTLGK